MSGADTRRDLPIRPLALFVAAALALSACSSPPELPRLGAEARILAFGDSLTHGTGVDSSVSYPAVLERRLGRRVIESGVPGELSAEGRRRLPRVLDRVRPDLLILCHGGNDILRGRDGARTRANLAAMVRMAQERDIDVVLIGVPTRGLFTDTADFYYEVAEETGVPLEDEVVADIIAEPALKSDAVHPNAAGYGRMAAAVQRLLAAAGAIEDVH